jgi:cyclopropane fatty-acyl-phospholipid synthase-like methyltransferase
MSELPTKQTFADMYAEEAPWDVGRPQKVFVEAAEQVRGPLLDAGCGTGDTALFFAQRGLGVTGVDFLPEPIARAKRKAQERGVQVDFRVQNALELASSKEQFASIVDSGLFHTFPDEQRRQYVAGLAHVLKPGGKLFLLCFSDAEPGEFGPRRVTQAEIRSAFATGWKIESISPAVFETNPKFKGPQFSPGGPHAWFTIAQRT